MNDINEESVLGKAEYRIEDYHDVISYCIDYKEVEKIISEYKTDPDNKGFKHSLEIKQRDRSIPFETEEEQDNFAFDAFVTIELLNFNL